jgi:hypothetical protein
VVCTYSLGYWQSNNFHLSDFYNLMISPWVTKLFLLTAADLKNARVYEGQPQGGKPDCTLTLADDDMVQIVSNKPQSCVCLMWRMHHYPLQSSGCRCRAAESRSVGSKSTARDTLFSDSYATDLLAIVCSFVGASLTANLQDLCKCVPSGQGE